MFNGGVIGSGVYGEIYQSLLDGQKVVVKRNLASKYSSFSSSIRELDILVRTRGHPHIVQLLRFSINNPFDRVLRPTIEHREDPLFFILEQASGNLLQYIKSNCMNYRCRKWMMAQLLLGVEELHRLQIIHRDLKPENLLVFQTTNEATLKICDFGLSVIYAPNEGATIDVVTAWYRAPEICQKQYHDFKVDLWSVGCIFYELIIGKVLFEGVEESNLLEEIEKRVPIQFDFPPGEINSFNKSPGTFPQFEDLLNKLLKINPDQRLSATQALNHPFFESLYPMIEQVRTHHHLESEVYRFPSRENLQYVIDGLNYIFSDINSFAIYNYPRSIFHALDYYNRAVETLSGSELLFYVCLYLGLKYMAEFGICYEFKNILPHHLRNLETITKAGELEEKLLIEIFRGKLYRPTVYELLPAGTNLETMIRIQTNLSQIYDQELSLDAVFQLVRN